MVVLKDGDCVWLGLLARLCSILCIVRVLRDVDFENSFKVDAYALY
jgi:hypothetical protein